MRSIRLIRNLAAVAAAAVVLAGCGQSGAASQTGGGSGGTAVLETTDGEAQSRRQETGAGAVSPESAETNGTETKEAGQGSAQPNPDTDRYEELTDRSGDEGKLVIYFLDLDPGDNQDDKSGDASILISPDGKVMLLDAGLPEAAGLVAEALRDLGIERIDYLVASHPHIDHIGGVPEVMSEFPVDSAYRSYVEYTTQTYRNYEDALKEAGTNVVYLKTGDEFDFGSQVRVTVLGPDQEIVYPDGFPDNSTQFLNNHSLLLKFTYGETTALFGGDLYVSQERDYIDRYGDQLKVDVAKANHHGKDTSNLRKWIKTVSPKIVVAMGDEVGSMDVYNNYVKEGAEYHHTVNDGMVKVIMDDQGNCQAIDQKDSWMN